MSTQLVKPFLSSLDPTTWFFKIKNNKVLQIQRENFIDLSPISTCIELFEQANS